MKFFKEILKKKFCCHKWEKYARVKIIGDGVITPSNKTIGFEDTLICVHCGKITQISL